MSIRTRLDDAVFLWSADRREGAFMSVLVAVAATARLRHGTAFGDRDAFERFMTTALPVRLSVEFRGELHSIEHVLYKWLRCELVHEAGLPVDIEFMLESKPYALSVRAGGAPDFVLRLSESWFHHLVGAVIKAPENTKELRGWKP
jgi:hypothetical protein